MKKIVSLLKRYRILILGYFPFIFLLFTFLFLLLRFPEVSGRGVKNGIELCINVLIPSLFPFMVFSGFLISSGLILKKIHIFNFLSKKLFSLPYLAVPVLLMSFLGGYPVGAKSVSDLYKTGNISSDEGRRMLLFCVNPSPSFVISSVGFFMLRSNKAGAVIYLSIVISSILVGVFSRFLNIKSENNSKTEIGNNDLKFAAAFTKSVKDSGVSMAFICAFVVFFSAIFELVDILPFSQETKLFLKCIIEVTNGCKYGVTAYSLPVITAIIYFGGLCTVFQVMGFLTDVGLNIKHYLAVRLIGAGISSLVCHFLLKIFPVTIETFSSGSIPKTLSPSYSLPVSAGLIVMTLLFILGDSFALEKKRVDTK